MHSLSTYIFALLFTLLSALNLNAEEKNVQRKEFSPDRLLVYKTVDELKLHLHVFEPKGVKKSDKRPAIIFFFGGGWQSGTPTQFYQQSRHLSEQGLICVTAEYRVKSRNKTTPFECVKDAKSAIRYLRQHATELGIDPERIAASGSSAGGHLAGSSVLLDGIEELGQDLSISSRPNLAILYNPVLDTTIPRYAVTRIQPDRQILLSLSHQVKKTTIPTLIFHGTADLTVPFKSTENFTKSMKEIGNDCTLISYPDAGHGVFNSPVFRPKNKLKIYQQSFQQTKDFLKKHGFTME